MGLVKRGLDMLQMAGRNVARKLRNDADEVAENTTSIFKEAIKSIFSGIIIMAKPILIKGLIIIVILACAWLVISNAVMTTSANSISSFISSGEASSSVSKGYESTGSLVSATDADIQTISRDYINYIKNGDLSYLQAYLSSNVQEKNTDNSGVYLETSKRTDPVDLGENFTLYEHILNTERYNFNRITWVKYIRGEEQEELPELTVDSETRLQYPQDENYDLEHFITIARPYLQSWVIPMSMLSGVALNVTNDDVANFAYSIISDAYHKIQIDQHNLDTKTRVNNYRIYDKTTTVINVERTCTTYKGTETYTFCSDKQVNGNPTVEKDVRENLSSTDSISTTTNYVLSSVEAFDNIQINDFDVELYYVDNNNYNEDLTKVDSHTSKEEEYTYYDEIIDSNYTPNNNQYDGSVSLAGLEVVDTTTTTIKYMTIVEKEGTSYTDTIIWKDKLKYNAENSTKQEGYTVEQLTDYLGEEVSLTVNEKGYYDDIASQDKLNLIDIINAEDTIYYSYTKNPASKNIGYTRDYLTTSYDILKTHLTDLYANYNYSIAYGQSIVPNIDIEKSVSSSYDYSWLAEGAFGWPVPGNKTVGHLFGYTIAYYGYSSYHKGIDLWPDPSKGAYQTEVVAARAGTVIVANDAGYSNIRNNAAGWGNYIKIDHGDGTYTLYAHLNTGSFKVTQGQPVEAGQVIAHMGSSGNSSGEHLHFELYNGSEQVDPLKYIYNVKSKGTYAEYDTLTDDQKYAITSGGQYEYVSSK